jgi:hypothetical protein
MRNFEFQIWVASLGQPVDEGSTPIGGSIDGEDSDEKMPEDGRSKVRSFSSVQYRDAEEKKRAIQ